MSINDTQIRNAKPQAKVYRLTDGGGLQLEVRPSGAKYWRYRYRIDGRENMFAAGEYVQPPRGETPAQAASRVATGKLTLAEARTKLAEWRTSVKQGVHPVAIRAAAHHARRDERANTFRVVAEAWIQEKRQSVWTKAYAAQVESALNNHILPIIGDRPIAEVKAKDLSAAFTGMSRLRQPDAARGDASDKFRVLPVMIKQWCSAVFRHAMSEGLVEIDPTSALRGRVVRVKSINHRHLAPKEIADLVRRLNDYGGNPKTVIATRLLLLTFVRPGELRNASWDEFDLEKSSWSIPAVRMKKRLDHWVHLAPQTLELLAKLRSLTGNDELLFPNERDPERSMSATTLNRCLERLGLNGVETIDFSAHGFRSTASTLLNESGKFSADAIERQLAHVKVSIRGVYNKAEHSEERKLMMVTWANWVDEYCGQPYT